MDARLEYGVEMGIELSLRILSMFSMYNLPYSISTTIHVSQWCLYLFLGQYE